MTLGSHASVEKNATYGAPELLAAALKPVQQELADLKKLLPEYLPLSTQTSKDIVQHVFDGGGKHIRPALYLLACKMIGYKGSHLLPIAAVCEYVHTASLLHDDVVDNSSMRRNKPTANRKWGDESAVLVGDLIYSTASEMMAKTGKLEIVTSFASAIRQMSEGELLQLENILHLDLSEQVYFDILKGKTAVLMGAACRAAGILGEASLEQKNALEEFGHSLGIAFQLMDDALDYTGLESIFGKTPLSDLREGKVTLPLILLKKQASPGELEYVSQVLQKEKLSNEEVYTIAHLVQKYQTALKTMERAKEFTYKALNALATHFPPSSSRQDLENLANGLLYRIQ